MRKQASAPVLASQNVPHFLRHVRERGGDADALIERFGLPASVEQLREARLAVTDLQALGEACADAVGDRFFGLSTAAWVPRGAFGLVEFSCRSAPTVAAAVERLVRYHFLLNDVDQCRMEERGQHRCLTFMVPGQPLCWGRHFNECSLALIARVAREASGGRFAAERVWFAHPDPGDPRRLHEVFGTSRVTFGAGVNGMAIHRDVLAQPLASANEALLRMLDDQAATKLGGRPAPEDFLGKLRDRMRREPGAGAGIDRVAAEMRMSTRTLQRRLVEHNTSYQRLIEDVRQGHARTLLEDPRRSIKEIAAVLGYSGTRALVRAVKGGWGLPPGAARRSRPA